jgi:hypothetical protein
MESREKPYILQVIRIVMASIPFLALGNFEHLIFVAHSVNLLTF